MSITIFTKPKAILSIIVALVFLLDANLILQLFSISLDGSGIMVARILGGVYLGLGISFYMIKTTTDISETSAKLYGFSEMIAAVACLIATLNGDMNIGGWILVVAYAFFSLCFIWVSKEVQASNQL